MSSQNSTSPMARRFRGFLPVIIDVETGGFNAQTDALLEIAAVILALDTGGRIRAEQTISTHVHPFPGANIEEKALEITGIRPDSPLRAAREGDDKGKFRLSGVNHVLASHRPGSI